MTEILGYENLYSVTTSGDVISMRTGRALVGDLNNSGYKRVILCKNKERQRFFIHRLVACTLIDNPENKRTVNHIDGVKTNNASSNLEWATDSEQHKHSWALGLEKITPKFAQEFMRKIQIEDTDRMIILKQQGKLKVAEEAKRYNVTIAAIYNSITRRLKQ